MQKQNEGCVNDYLDKCTICLDIILFLDRTTGNCQNTVCVCFHGFCFYKL